MITGLVPSCQAQEYWLHWRKHWSGRPAGDEESGHLTSEMRSSKSPSITKMLLVCVSDLVETFAVISTIMHVSFCTHRQMISWCGLLLTYQEFFEWGRAGQHQTSRATVDFHVAAQQRHSQEPTHLQEDRTEYLRPAAPGRGTSGSLRSLCSHPLVLLSVRQREITCTDTHTLKYWIMNTK